MTSSNLDTSRILILLSNTYPYGDGEQFLAEELRYLAKAFDRILIFPVNRIPEQMPQTHTLPAGVHVYPQHKPDSTLHRMGYVFRDGGRMKRPAVRHEYRHIARSMKRKAVLRYFEGKSYDTLSHILEVLEMDGITDSIQETINVHTKTRIVLYSYWYFVGCRVALDLKAYFQDAFSGMEDRLTLIAVSRGHGYDIHAEEVSGGYLPYRDFFPRALDQSYPISQEGRNRLVEGCPSASTKIALARLGTTNPAGAVDIVTKIPDVHAPFTFVSCAYVRPVKRLNLLCQAFARLDDWLITEGYLGLKWRWVHLGGGPEFEALEGLAAKCLSKDRYQFMGTVGQDDVHRYYMTKPADLFVNVSRNEGVPVSIMEAMSYGIPTLATDVGGTSEIVIPGQSGHLLPPNPDVALITRRLGEQMVKDPLSRAGMRVGARAIWERLCQSETNYQMFAECLAGIRPLHTFIP